MVRIMSNDRLNYRIYVKDYRDYNKNVICPKMCQVHSLHLNTNKVIISTKYGNVSKYINEDNILMQCIGLRDKNNKLIYEDDIIKVKNKQLAEKILVVKFNPYMCRFELYDKDDNNHYIMSFDDINNPNTDVEVIGNIHET